MASALPFVGTIGPMQRRLGAIVLGSQVPVIVFGALAVWGVARAQDRPDTGLYLGLGMALALVSAVAAGMLKRPFGVTLGWIVQFLLLATSVLAPMIVLVAALFVILWATALVQGAKMDDLTARHLAENAHRAPESP